MSDQQPLTDTFFDSFELQPNVLSGLHAAGFTRCTPIQALTLPLALVGRDVAGQAQTGTGKTGAFLVAVMNRLLTQPAFIERRASDPRALIIAPTRELAIQIEKDFRSLGRDSGLKSALIYGGVDYDKQRDQLRAGVDLLIATPGRLLDYFKQHVFSFNAVEVMVIDEADRMFDLGFIADVRYILRRLPPREKRQCLLFSATLSHRVLELAYEHMNEAVKLTVESDNVTADRVRQVIYFPATEEKLPLLIGLLSRTDAQRSMVFVNMKVAAEKVARRLERQGFAVGMLSGDVPQKKRQSLLGKFQRGEIEILIATDVAARGLHTPDVSHVFNYDLPLVAEDYVHRIGRTARLGAEGDAITSPRHVRAGRPTSRIHRQEDSSRASTRSCSWRRRHAAAPCRSRRRRWIDRDAPPSSARARPALGPPATRCPPRRARPRPARHQSRRGAGRQLPRAQRSRRLVRKASRWRGSASRRCARRAPPSRPRHRRAAISHRDDSAQVSPRRRPQAPDFACGWSVQTFG